MVIFKKWLKDYSRKEAERMVKVICGKRTYDYPAGYSTPVHTSTSICSDRVIKDLRFFNGCCAFYEDRVEDVEDGLRRIAAELKLCCSIVTSIG